MRDMCFQEKLLLLACFLPTVLGHLILPVRHAMIRPPRIPRIPVLLPHNGLLLRSSEEGASHQPQSFRTAYPYPVQWQGTNYNYQQPMFMQPYTYQYPSQVQYTPALRQVMHTAPGQGQHFMNDLPERYVRGADFSMLSSPDLGYYSLAPQAQANTGQPPVLRREIHPTPDSHLQVKTDPHMPDINSQDTHLTHWQVPTHPEGTMFHGSDVPANQQSQNIYKQPMRRDIFTTRSQDNRAQNESPSPQNTNPSYLRVPNMMGNTYPELLAVATNPDKQRVMRNEQMPQNVPPVSAQVPPPSGPASQEMSNSYLSRPSTGNYISRVSFDGVTLYEQSRAEGRNVEPPAQSVRPQRPQQVQQGQQIQQIQQGQWADPLAYYSQEGPPVHPAFHPAVQPGAQPGVGRPLPPCPPYTPFICYPDLARPFYPPTH